MKKANPIKRILSLALAVFTLLSCCTVFAFAEPVDEIYTLKLYAGNLPGNIPFDFTWNANSFAQKFVIPTVNNIRSFSLMLGTQGNGEGALSFYRWTGDYSETIGATALYSVDFTCPNNDVLKVDIPEDVMLSGDLLWKITPKAGSKIVPYGGTALADGCLDFIHGQLTNMCGGSYAVSGWSGVVTFGATLEVQGDPNAAATPSVTYDVLAYTPPETVTMANIIDMQDGKDVAQRAYVNGPFCGIGVKLATHGTKDSDITLSVYKWDSSYEKTVAADPVLSKRLENCTDNIVHWFSFGKTLNAGHYLFLLHDMDGKLAVYASQDNSTSLGSAYVDGNETIRDVWFTVRFTEKVEKPFIATEVKVKAYGNGNVQHHRILAKTASLGQRVKITAPFKGFAFGLPTWSTTESEATLSAYAWNESYEKTVASEPLATQRFVCRDNADHWVYFDEEMPAGEYLFLISDVKGTVGCYYCTENTVSLGYAYLDGRTEQMYDLYLKLSFNKAPEVPFEKCYGSIDEIDGTHLPPEQSVPSADSLINTHNVQPSTWVFTDGLGRESLTNADVGNLKDDKTLAMFYWQWHISFDNNTDAFNIQNFIEKYPEAKNDVSFAGWNDSSVYYWNEPIYGYYRSDDNWVLRRHAELLANAGVDAVFFDNTNSDYVIRDGYNFIFNGWTEATKSGVNAPKISYCLPFWEEGGAASNTARQLKALYFDVYRQDMYQDMWFYYEGKPMIMANGEYLDTTDVIQSEIKNFFTFRRSYPWYVDDRADAERLGTWAWSAASPQPYYYKVRSDISKKNVEQISVSVAVNYDYVKKELAPMNGLNIVGRSYTTDNEGRYLDAVNGKNTSISETSLYGYHFAEQFEYALSVDPKVIFVTGWNEWTVSRQKNPWMGIENAFGDQFNDEFSRDIEPSKGALKDHYYYQFINFARKFKGAEPIPTPSAKATIDLTAGQEQWAAVEPYYAAYIGNTMDRNTTGRADVKKYRDFSGRNDIIGAKVARDDEFVYFNVECNEDITPYTDKLWMNLYIDVDQTNKGWETFDFVVNKTAASEKTSVLEKFTEGYASEKVADVEYTVDGKFMTVKIAKSDLGLTGDDYTINFAWTDNVHDADDMGAITSDGWVYSEFSGDIMDFYLTGDVAPGARFKFSYISNEENANKVEDETTDTTEDTTDVVTEDTTDVTTEATTDGTVEDTTAAADGGCKSSVALSVIAVITALGAAVVLKKRD